MSGGEVENDFVDQEAPFFGSPKSINDDDDDDDDVDKMADQKTVTFNSNLQSQRNLSASIAADDDDDDENTEQ